MFKVLDRIRPYLYFIIVIVCCLSAVHLLYQSGSLFFTIVWPVIVLVWAASKVFLSILEILNHRLKEKEFQDEIRNSNLIIILMIALPGLSAAQNDPFKIIPDNESTAWDWSHYKRNASLYSFSFSAGLFTGAEKQFFSIAKYRNTILPQAPIQQHPDGYTFQDYRDRWLGPESANGYGTWYRGWHWYEINGDVRLYKRKWFLSGPGYMFRDVRHTMEFGKIWSYRLATHYYKRPRNKWQHALDLVLVTAAQGLGQMVITSILVKN